jgi:hypothetical protein
VEGLHTLHLATRFFNLEEVVVVGTSGSDRNTLASPARAFVSVAPTRVRRKKKGANLATGYIPVFSKANDFTPPDDNGGSSGAGGLGCRDGGDRCGVRDCVSHPPSAMAT